MMKAVQPAPDTLLSGISHIEILQGGLARFVVYVERLDPVTKEPYREYPPAQVLPLEVVPEAIMQATAACAASLVGKVKRLLPHQLH